MQLFHSNLMDGVVGHHNIDTSGQFDTCSRSHESAHHIVDADVSGTRHIKHVTTHAQVHLSGGDVGNSSLLIGEHESGSDAFLLLVGIGLNVEEAEVVFHCGLSLEMSLEIDGFGLACRYSDDIRNAVCPSSTIELNLIRDAAQEVASTSVLDVDVRVNIVGLHVVVARSEL